MYKIKNNPKINQIRKKETESKTRQKLVKETLNSDAIGKRHLLIQIQQCKNENNVETCSKSIIKTPKRRQRCRSGVLRSVFLMVELPVVHGYTGISPKLCE